MSRIGTNRLILCTGRLHLLVAVLTIALAQILHDRIVAPDRLTKRFDLLVHVPEQLLVPGFRLITHRLESARIAALHDLALLAALFDHRPLTPLFDHRLSRSQVLMP
jgi:hypothetical protein